MRLSLAPPAQLHRVSETFSPTQRIQVNSPILASARFLFLLSSLALLSSTSSPSLACSYRLSASCNLSSTPIPFASAKLCRRLLVLNAVNSLRTCVSDCCVKVCVCIAWVYRYSRSAEPLLQRWKLVHDEPFPEPRSFSTSPRISAYV